MTNKFVSTTAIFIFSVVLIGCSGSKSDDSASTTTTTTTTDTAPKQTQEATFDGVVTDKATIVTSLGDIEIDLYGEDAPKTVANFVGLAERDFFNGILFHRVVTGFVIQAGDPKSKDLALKSEWGTGGETIYDGGKFEDELDPKAPSSMRGYVEGVVAMANSGPNTNSSQFFIVLNTPGAKKLSHLYTIFGYVSEGMDVVHGIARNGEGAPPANPIAITKVKTDRP